MLIFSTVLSLTSAVGVGTVTVVGVNLRLPVWRCSGFPFADRAVGGEVWHDGSSGTIEVHVNGPAIEVNLFYNGSEYDKVFLVR